MMYYKVDMTNNKADQALSELEDAFLGQKADNIFSVNTKSDGTLAWAKTIDPVTLQNPWQQAIIDSEQGANTKALADVYGDW